MITFLRSRPVEEISEAIATSRRREGTTALESAAASPEEIRAATEAGMLVVSSDPGTPAPSWILLPEQALAVDGIPGWRTTVLATDDLDLTLDAVVRTGSAFVRTSRSNVGAVSQRMDRPGCSVRVSVFVDDVAQATEAVSAGARRPRAQRLGF